MHGTVTIDMRHGDHHPPMKGPILDTRDLQTVIYSDRCFVQVYRYRPMYAEPMRLCIRIHVKGKGTFFSQHLFPNPSCKALTLISGIDQSHLNKNRRICPYPRYHELNRYDIGYFMLDNYRHDHLNVWQFVLATKFFSLSLYTIM